MLDPSVSPSSATPAPPARTGGSCSHPRPGDIVPILVDYKIPQFRDIPEKGASNGIPLWAWIIAAAIIIAALILFLGRENSSPRTPGVRAEVPAVTTSTSTARGSCASDSLTIYVSKTGSERVKVNPYCPWSIATKDRSSPFTVITYDENGRENGRVTNGWHNADVRNPTSASYISAVLESGNVSVPDSLRFVVRR